MKVTLYRFSLSLNQRDGKVEVLLGWRVVRVHHGVKTLKVRVVIAKIPALFDFVNQQLERS